MNVWVEFVVNSKEGVLFQKYIINESQYIQMHLNVNVRLSGDSGFDPRRA